MQAEGQPAGEHQGKFRHCGTRLTSRFGSHFCGEAISLIGAGPEISPHWPAATSHPLWLDAPLKGPAEQLRPSEMGKIDLDFVRLPPAVAAVRLRLERIARHRIVVVLPAKHPPVGNPQVNLGKLAPMFFVGMSESTDPGFRDRSSVSTEAAGRQPYSASSVTCPAPIL